MNSSLILKTERKYNDNNNIDMYTKDSDINNDTNIIKDKSYYSGFRSNKGYKFFDNNKKKKKVLFDFIHKKKKSPYEYININPKKIKSFINKRNKHITDRNNSSNKLNNKNLNIYFHEKQLDKIHNEISQKKMQEIFTISLDNIYNYNFNKKQLEENKSKRKYKLYHIKVNSMNVIKTYKNHRFNNIVIKRGELLNKLRNIKRNYSSLEKDKK